MEPKLRFRNYAPRDASLAESAEPLTVSSLAALPVPPPLQPLAEDAPVLLVPKKANWDLKRDLAPKTERLESMTQRAIAELVREKCAGASTVKRVGAKEDLDEVYAGPIDVAVLSRGFGKGEEDEGR